ncbi:MAG: phosphoenolpyruvate carboxykinase (GTP), partial [Proteobacteria bacterium]|nr:phosphoenolpyruvate carboxykinase (GTP) [Pseudomonadota bacterium]
PGTNAKSNKNAFDTIQSDTIFTNVALTEDNEPWWEDKKVGEPVIDWLGGKYDPEKGPAAHPNSRFTVASDKNPSYSSLADAPEGVPISAIVFGGRRRKLAPLVYEAKSWAHGVLVGAGVASETTAAATGQVGVVRRDPMAMKPFCGYNFADYWGHWLKMGEGSENMPRIFHVNWFRQDDDGNFLWPGFGENMRVLLWMIDRIEGRAGAVETAIGYLPQENDIDLDGIDVDSRTMQELLSVEAADWRQEMSDVGEYLDSYGARIPDALRTEYQAVVKALS